MRETSPSFIQFVNLCSTLAVGQCPPPPPLLFALILSLIRLSANLLEEAGIRTMLHLLLWVHISNFALSKAIKKGIWVLRRLWDMHTEFYMEHWVLVLSWSYIIIYLYEWSNVIVGDVQLFFSFHFNGEL